MTKKKVSDHRYDPVVNVIYTENRSKGYSNVNCIFIFLIVGVRLIFSTMIAYGM